MKILLVWAFLMSLYSLPKAGDCETTHDQILSIIPTTPEHVDALQDLGHHEKQNESLLLQPVSSQYIKTGADVHLFVSGSAFEAVMDLLQRHNITHHLLLDNVKELIEAQIPSPYSRAASNFYESYHTVEEIHEWIDSTAQMHPDRVETFSIGESFEKRPLKVLKLSGEKRPDKKAIFMDCGFHAREWISPAFCLWFVNHTLSNYKHEENITHILDNMDIYVLPLVNPDGYSYTWGHVPHLHHRMWRKNRSHRGDSTCLGVDLNRNFNANWCTQGASHQPCQETYCGPSPHSEPETQALANFLSNHSDSVQIYYSIHSYSQMLLFPYSYTRNKTSNHDELYELVKEVAEKIKAFSGNEYRYGAGSSTIYLAPGGSDDWAYDQGIKYAFTFELQDRGEYGFLLPPNRIAGACKEALIAVETISLRVIEKSNSGSQKKQK